MHLWLWFFILATLTVSCSLLLYLSSHNTNVSSHQSISSPFHVAGMKLKDFFLVSVCNLQFHWGLSSINSTSSHTKPCNLQTSRLLNNPREFTQPTVRFNHKLRAHLTVFFRLPWTAMCVLWQRWHSLHDILINWKLSQKQFFSGDYGVECDFLWNYAVISLATRICRHPQKFRESVVASCHATMLISEWCI